MSQLTRHVSYIKGTVSFLLTHVKNTPTLSSQSVPDKEQEELINRISEVAHSVSELKKQVIELEQCVQQVCVCVCVCVCERFLLVSRIWEHLVKKNT